MAGFYTARDEIIPVAELPRRFCAHTSCFRREAGSAGKDTRGLLRVHEFDKVEILAYCTLEQAPDLHAEILSRAEGIIRDLCLAYRILDLCTGGASLAIHAALHWPQAAVDAADISADALALDLCTGDIGNSAARTFDIEVYAPGVDRWLEVSSVSWFSDYQARRANLRFKPEGGKGTEVLHTCNGSALAVPRVWAALVETYRQPDGTVAVPELLQPYLRGATVIG